VTDQEKDLLQLQAWKQYQASRSDFLACKAKLQKFREPMRVLVEKLVVDLLEISEQEVLAFPVRDSFVDAFEEFRAAARKYEDAIDEARKFDWPVLPADEPASLCRLRPR
jgi:hypothetical protein